MATHNHKMEVRDGNTTDVLHPETNTGQVYDYDNAKWLKEVIGTLSNLTTTQKASLVLAINEIANKASTHEAKIATTTQLGHVKPDGITVRVNSAGVLSANVSGEGGGGGGGFVDLTEHETSDAPHQYGGKFEWRYNADTNSLDLVVLE